MRDPTALRRRPHRRDRDNDVAVHGPRARRCSGRRRLRRSAEPRFGRVRIDHGDGRRNHLADVLRPLPQGIAARGPVRDPQRQSCDHESSFCCPSDRSDLTLSVRPGSRTGRITGMTLGAVGAVAMVVGFMFSPATTFEDKVGPSPARLAGDHRPRGNCRLAAVGGVVWRSSETRVSSSSGRTLRPRRRARRASGPALALHRARSGVLIGRDRRRRRSAGACGRSRRGQRRCSAVSASAASSSGLGKRAGPGAPLRDRPRSGPAGPDRAARSSPS